MESRAVDVPFSLRDVGSDGLTLAGHAAVWNSVTRIDSWEGRFDEQISRGAFKRGINAGKVPVLMFNHGKHPTIGDIPIGAINEIREDDHGLYVEARLHDNDLVKPVRDAIASKAIRGMSFRFSVPKGKDTRVTRAGDVPLRTIHEVDCVELGPVVFPAYEQTDVMVRAMRDGYDSDLLAAFAAHLKPFLLGTSLELAKPPSDQATEATRGLSTAERARVLRELALKEILP